MNAQNPVSLTRKRSTRTTGHVGSTHEPSLLTARKAPAVMGSTTEAATVQPPSDTTTASRLLQCLHAFGYAQATIDSAQALLNHHGEDALRDAVRRAKRGEAGGLATLGEWMLREHIPPTTRSPLTDPWTPIEFVPVHKTPTTPLRLRDRESPDQPLFADPSVPVQFVPIDKTPTTPLVLGGGAAYASAGEPQTGPRLVMGSLTPIKWDQVKVFGAKAALTLVADVTRAGAATVTIEAAAAMGGPDRRYDWANKIRFQLTVSELQLVTALLLGHLESVNFRNHGDKWLRAAHQEPDSAFAGLIKVAVGQGAGTEAVIHTVAIDPSSLGLTISIFLRQAASSLKLPVALLPAVLTVVSAAHVVRVTHRSRH